MAMGGAGNSGKSRDSACADNNQPKIGNICSGNIGGDGGDAVTAAMVTAACTI
jgi:hypothetical protein